MSAQRTKRQRALSPARVVHPATPPTHRTLQNPVVVREQLADPNKGKSQPPMSSVPFLRIAKRYQPQPAALDALVDVLHLLLVDGLESHGSPKPARNERTCFPQPPE
jgi:hypothetical protein